MIRTRVRARADAVTHDGEASAGCGVEEQIKQVPLLRLVRHVGDEIGALEREGALRRNISRVSVVVVIIVILISCHRNCHNLLSLVYKDSVSSNQASIVIRYDRSFARPPSKNAVATNLNSLNRVERKKGGRGGS